MVAMKKHQYRKLKMFVVTGLAVFLISCSTTALFSGTSTEPPVEYLIVTSTPTTDEVTENVNSDTDIENSDLLYSDDFSDMYSGWEASDDDTSRYYYSDGEYFIEANSDVSYYFIINEETFDDGVFSVNLRMLSGDQELTGGMVFWRYLDNDNFYALTMSPNGEYSIHRFLHGKYDLISLPEYSPSLNTGDKTNKVTIAFHGDTSEIYFNGQFAYQFNDPSIKSGNIGLGASPDKSSPVKVSFDDLSVYRYNPGSPNTPFSPAPTSEPEYRYLSWSQLVKFLSDDHTNWNEYDLETYNCVDYAVDLAENARNENIKVRLVGVDFVGQPTGHAFVEFETIDRGIIFVEPQGDNTYSNVKIGNQLCDDWGEYECMGVISDIQYFGACDHQHNCTIYLP